MQRDVFASPYFQLHALAEGVYAAIARPGSGAMANAGIIDLGAYSLIFDTFFTPAAAADLRRAAELLLKSPLRYIINSHRHGDHVLGNQVFADLTIVSTATTRTLIETLTADFVKNVRSAPGFAQFFASQQKPQSDPQRQLEQAAALADIQALSKAMPKLQLRLPDFTFEDQLDLYGTRRTVQVRSVGAAHTPSDTYLYLPDDDILFAGDLVQVRFHPMLTQGSPAAWRTTLDRLRRYTIKHLVPGHGDVGLRRDIKIIDGYIEELFQLASETNATEFALEQVPVPQSYAAWAKAEAFYENLRFLMTQPVAESA